MSVPVQLNQALETLYGNSDPAVKEQANEYLLAFQRSEQAWQTAFDILAQPSSSVQASVFAAQTLRSKVQYDFAQLPHDQLSALKNSLLQLMVAYTGKQRLVITQLCITLANFALQYLDWKNAVDEIVSVLSGPATDTLLEFLKILPEELLDVKKTPLTDEEFEVRANELLAANVQSVLYILTTLAESRASNSASTNRLVLECIKSWIIDIPFEQVLSNNALCTLIFDGLLADDMFDTAIDCLSTIVGETADCNNDSVVEALYEQLLKLKPLMAQTQDDPEKVERFTELFATAGEAWHVQIAKKPYNFKPLVDIILQLTAYEEDLDVVKYTFKFWYDLKTLLISDARREARACFTPTYTQLVEIMIKHLRYPTTSNSTELRDLFHNDKEAEDKFKEFRYDMGDVLKDCCAVIGAPVALDIPFKILQSQMNLQMQGQPVTWQEIEAPLFSMRAMAKEVGTNENTILPQIMRYLVQLPENPKIRYAATLVLGRYTEWTAKHPEHLEEQLNYITSGFQQQQNMDIIIAASHALKYFCMDCAELLSNYLEQLYNFYSNVEPSLDIDSLYDITEGIAHILKEERDQDKLYNITLMFWKPTLEKLNQYSSAQPATAQELDKLHTQIADTVEILTIYVDALRPKSFSNASHPVARIVMEIVWPLVVRLVEAHGRSVKVSERCMKLVRRSLQSYKTYLLPVVSTTAELLVSGFQNYKHGCYLWVSGAFIKEYAAEDDVSADIKEAVWGFSVQQAGNFIKIFNELGKDDIPEYTELVEDFFRMGNDVLMFLPVKLLESSLVEPVYRVAVRALETYPEYGTISSVLQFLVDLYSWGFETPPVSMADDIPEALKYKVLNFAVATGEELLTKLLGGLIFTFPSDCWPEANELVVKLVKLSMLQGGSKVGLGWLDRAMLSLPRGSVSDSERLKLLRTVETAINSNDFRRVRTSVRDFVSWYRRKNVDRRNNQ
ncbi:hypothetical protein KL927_000716 [Ogataea polymorpha]|nr:hypothetical protein KL927_000716 [Ogataea polymorpha]